MWQEPTTKDSYNDRSITVGLGGNLPSCHGMPRRTLEAALSYLDNEGIRILRCSRFWKTAPVPASDQPWFVNAVALVDTPLAPADLLAALHAVEAVFGRQRGGVNAARCLDLDLLAYGRRIESGIVMLPHPRLAERAFVLLPLREVAPEWRHPLDGRTVEQMIADLPPGQQALPMDD